MPFSPGFSPGFRALVAILLLLILEIKPQFVVKELEACCHHYINLKCKDSEKIAIIQSRYIVSSAKPKADRFTSGESRVKAKTLENNVTEISGHQDPYLSLWDMDIQFANDLRHPPEAKSDYSSLNTPEWAKSHRTEPQPHRYVPPDPLHGGLRFTSQRVLEMPPYEERAVLDKDTVWTQPLFPLVQDDGEASHRRSHGGGLSAISGRVNNVRRAGSRGHGVRSDSAVPCMSYEKLSDSSAEDFFDRDRKRKYPRPHWHYKDLRPVFNKRCSGRSECVVNLLRNKLRDQDLTSVCEKWPEGRILVKYLCFSAFSGDVHSKCNVDVGTAGEGFILNPGYPNVYAGDNLCQWRLRLPESHQKILLLFLDISLRGEEKSRCRDQIVVSDGATKLLSTCGDHSSAIGILSYTNRLNVTFTPESRLAFPKRGFLLYFRGLGCDSLLQPLNSYLVFSNGSHALFRCEPGYLFHGSMLAWRWVECSAPLKRRRSLHCQETGLDLGVRDPNDLIWPQGPKTYNADVFRDTGLPILLMLSLFLLNFVAFLWIRRKRKALTLRLESEASTAEFEEIQSHTPEESTFTLSSGGFEDASNHSRDRPRGFLRLTEDQRGQGALEEGIEMQGRLEGPFDSPERPRRGYSLLPQSEPSSIASPASSFLLPNASSQNSLPNTLSHFSRTRRSTPV